MSIVFEIQAGAADGGRPLATVLRQTLILAYRLRHADLKAWVEAELNGYELDAELPAYRQHRCRSFAYIRNPYVGEMQSAGVMTSGQPEYVRDYLNRPVRFRQGAAALDSLVAREGDLRELWPTDLTIRHAATGYDGFEALRAWKSISRATVVGVLDAIRNRLLQFVLELEDQAPEVADDDSLSALASNVVTQVFNTYIVGDHNHVSGAATATTGGPPVPVGDAHAFQDVLVRMGVPADRALELVQLAKDEKPVAGRSMGERVKGWLTAFGGGVGEVAKGATTELIVAALKQFWGLDS